MARSFTERQIKSALKKSFGAVARRYEIDETYTDFEIGLKGSRFGALQIDSRHEAGVVETQLRRQDIPAEMRKTSKDGYWVVVPKIVTT